MAQSPQLPVAVASGQDSQPPSLQTGIASLKKRWIEKDALASLRSAEEHRIDSRVATISSLSEGWTAAGVDLIGFARATTNPYPSMVISDGKTEVVAYMATETAQSSAFRCRPSLAPGSRVRLNDLLFMPEPVCGSHNNINNNLTDNNNPTSTTPGVTFALVVRGIVQTERATPILNLNYSRTFSQAVGRWMVEQMDGGVQTVDGADNNNNDPPGTKKRSLEDDDDSSVSSKEDDRKKPAAKRSCNKQLLTFEEKLQKLKEYKDVHGHCNAPVSYKHGTFGLGVWINQLRTTRDTLPKQRIQALERVGFVWDLAEYNWNKNYDKLRRFQQEHHSVVVPIAYQDAADGSHLGHWCYNQKQAFKKGTLKPHRERKLLDLGFDFTSRQRRSSK